MPIRTVYVDKPVFAKPDPNDPIRYVLKPSTAQPEPVEPQQAMSPDMFQKLRSLMGKPVNVIPSTPEDNEIQANAYLDDNNDKMSPHAQEMANYLISKKDDPAYDQTFKEVIDNNNFSNEDMKHILNVHDIIQGN